MPATSLWHAMIVLGWAFILSGLGLLAWDCLSWLRDGFWTVSSLSDLWLRSPLGSAYDAQRWDDMQGLHLILHRILHWLGRVPTCLALVALGLGLAWSGNGWLVEAEQNRASNRRASGLR